MDTIITIGIGIGVLVIIMLALNIINILQAGSKKPDGRTMEETLY